MEQENDIGIWLKLETSNISMNLWSETLAFAAANRWYSSNIDVKHHFWSFLKQPTRQPVRCLPRLQWIRTGWFFSSRSTFSAMRILWSGIFTNGSKVFESPLVKGPCFWCLEFHKCKEISLSKSGTHCSKIWFFHSENSPSELSK
jgi:hypothetical protein